jgi:hypothetical protein
MQRTDSSLRCGSGQLWLKYAEMEMRHRNVNRARNIWDRFGRRHLIAETQTLLFDWHAIKRKLWKIEPQDNSEMDAYSLCQIGFHADRFTQQRRH